MVSSIVISLLAGIGVLILSKKLIRSSHDDREPPIRDDSVPILSTIFNMARKGSAYWASHMGLPIYTLKLPGISFYVVNATHLIPLVQRQVDTISFAHILLDMATNVMALSRTGLEIISRDPLGNQGFISETWTVNHMSLCPGPNLDALHETMWRTIVNSLGDDTGRKTVRLQEWISREVTMAITEAVYGSMNPFRDPGLIVSWSDFKSGFLQLSMNILPGLTARKSLLAREKLVKAFEKYYSNGGIDDKDASAFIKTRHQCFVQHGLSSQDIARIEATTSFALISNAMSGTFWLIYHIISNPSLLEECRDEVISAFKQDGSAIDNIQKSCPILSAVFKEVLRIHTHGVSVRKVVQDHLLDDKYLLKKGNLVLIPSKVQHSLPEVWGDDVAEFDHRRFLGTEKTNRFNPAADRSFGGGRSLCPGRHFATSEITAFAAIFILRFDARPVAGTWAMPTTKKSDSAISIDQPDRDVEVELCPRESELLAALSTDSVGGC